MIFLIRKKPYISATTSVMNPDSQEAIGRRKEFYNSKSVDDFLKKHGVPKSEHAMRSLIAMGLGKSDVDRELAEILEHVYFQVHAQQINIRDKANGKLIVSIRK